MPEFFSHKNHTDPWTRIDNSMVLTTNNLPDTILSTAVQEPPVNNDLDGRKSSDTDNLRQDGLMSGGACTHKNCTSTFGCSQIRVAAATDPVQDGSVLQVCERSTTHLTSPRQDGLELTRDREKEVAIPISPSISLPQTYGFVTALLSEQEYLPEAQPFGPEEIDYKSKDTFAPIMPSKHTSTDIIDLIHIEGTHDEIAQIRAICVKQIVLFKNELGPEPARIPPFELPVMEKQWKVSKNRHASRIQSTKRQTVIREPVTTMLKGGSIVKSNASHYSHVILAPQPEGTFQFCIDYRGLNEATESASWPIPNIRLMLGRLGAAKADTFGVVDLTAGYHQAPITMNTRIYIAFIDSWAYITSQDFLLDLNAHHHIFKK